MSGITMNKRSDSSPLQNHLVAALPQHQRYSLLCKLERVDMRLGQVVYESGDKEVFAYFPTSCIVSTLYVMENGSSAEISVVGNDGIVGIPLLMGGASTLSRAVVQSAGCTYRLSATSLEEEFRSHGPLTLLLLKYTQSLFTQIAQTAVCNRHHSIDQQLCRWLLMSLDRLDSDELVMTHELIANMLGVRREGVTESAGKLQKLGVIEYSRGHITVLDRPRLEQLSCECYAVVRNEALRLQPYLENSRMADRPVSRASSSLSCVSK